MSAKANASAVSAGPIFGPPQRRFVLLARCSEGLKEIDFRAPIVRHSLRTEDLAKARAQRDVLEKADNELWAAMLLDGKRSPQAIEAYKAPSCFLRPSASAIGLRMSLRVDLLKRSSSV